MKRTIYMGLSAGALVALVHSTTLYGFNGLSLTVLSLSLFIGWKAVTGR